MLSGGLEMSLQALPSFALSGCGAVDKPLESTVGRGLSEILANRDQLVSLETGCGFIFHLIYSKSKMFLCLVSFCLSI